MNIAYCKKGNVAYIYLQNYNKDRRVKKTLNVNDYIKMDFDSKGKLVGIEILDARKILDKKTLESLI